MTIYRVPVLTDPEPDAITAARGRGFTWIDIRDPDDAAIDRLAVELGLHPLAVEDTKKFRQRPKIEAYDDFVLIVAYGVAGTDLVETHTYVSEHWMLTVHRQPCVTLDQLHDEDASPVLALRVLDALTDTFFAAFDGLDERLDSLEDDIIDSDDTQTAKREILHLRRDTSGLRRILPAQRDALTRGMDDLAAIPGMGGEAKYLVRDVADHLERLATHAETARDRLLADLDMADNAQTTRLNLIGERLTLVATVFLPLTFVTGFFGMNFKWLTDHIETFGAFALGGIGGCVVSATVLLAYFQRKHWLG